MGYEDQLNLYAYVANDPVNNSDPTGKFFLVGAVIGAGLDLGLQLVENDGDFSRVDYGSVAVSGALGAVGGFAGNIARAARSGQVAVQVAGQARNVGTLNNTQRAILGGTAVATDGAAGAVNSARRGEDPATGAAEGAANAATSPVPSGTIVRTAVEASSETRSDAQAGQPSRPQQSDRPQVRPLTQPPSQRRPGCAQSPDGQCR